MCCPQPAQVGLPQVEQVILAHMMEAFLVICGDGHGLAGVSV